MKRFSKFSFFSFFIILILNFYFFNFSFASTYDEKVISDIENFTPEQQYNPENDLNISEKTLGIGKISILPDNMFYFLNNIENFIVSTFALNKNDQTNILLKSSSEKLKELEKCVSLQADECIKKGLENYNNSKNEIYAKINKLDNQGKNNITEKLTRLEINHYILLNNIKNTSTQAGLLDSTIENNLQNYSKFIKSLSDNITLKKNIRASIENNSQGKLKYIIINKYLENFKNYLNIEKRDLIDQIIEENNTELIKNINLIDIKEVGQTLRYYFYKINFNNIFEEISLIDNIYKLQDKIENSPNKENVKVAILNIKQIPISIFNEEIDKLDIKESEKKLEEMFDTGEIQKINLIELLNKYNNGKKNIKTYQLEEIQNKNILSLYNKLENITDSVQKEKYLNDALDQISPENKNLILTILNKIEADNSSDINTKIIIERIKEQRGLNNTDSTTNTELTSNTDTNSLMICPLIYDPVCGENGTIYNNQCSADKEGIKVLYKGECKILENDKLNNITAKELERGWYYGDKTQKKPGTPIIWINIDSDTKNAKWIDPKTYTNLKGLITE